MPPLHRSFRLALAVLAWLMGLSAAPAFASPAVLELRNAVAVEGSAETFPEERALTPTTLPDDWSLSHARHEGIVWYRFKVDLPAGAEPGELLGLYLPRVCTNAEVQLNGRIVFSGGAMEEPVTRNCHQALLAPLPAALLKVEANLIDVKLRGHALNRVSARQRGGGLAAPKIGPYVALATEQASHRFWNVTLVAGVNLVLFVLGALLVVLGLQNRLEAHLLYFGALSVTWAAMTARVWWREPPIENVTVEFLVIWGFSLVVAFAVQFLLSFARMRSPMLEFMLAAQFLVMPLSMLLAGSNNLFGTAQAWYLLLILEMFAAIGLYLRITWREKRIDFWPMAAGLAAVVLLLLVESVVQRGFIAAPAIPPMHVLMPLLFIMMALRMLQLFVRNLQAADANRSTLESRVKEITAEIERNFAQLAEMRVEQVTEKERKRIAADLHDDLGAKLLTIVHTSESERISTLAREALEEMRLSVRGLTGKPVRLSDALADWRAETVSRLGQANIEIDWRSPPEEGEQLLPARGFVQTTRILREAVSNIIKHSGASQVKVRCAVTDNHFGLNIQDNGKGIPMELDGKLDRGHGMSSMKHRAKQMQGQCLVESGPGYGTVIRLTLPL